MKRRIFYLIVLVIVLCISRHSIAGINDGLVAYYPFEGNTNDSSDQNNHGVEYGFIQYVNGRQGQAAQFDGLSYITASADPLPTSTRSISLWFKTPKVDNHPVLLAYGGISCGESLLMMLNHGWVPGSFFSTGHCWSNQAHYYYPTPPIDAWYHWVLVIDPNQSPKMKIYVNGIYVGSSDGFSMETYVSGKILSMGVAVYSDGTQVWWDDSHAGRFVGLLDEVRIYNRVLSESEIQLLAEYSPPAVAAFSNYGLVIAVISLLGSGFLMKRKYILRSEKLL